MLDADDRNVRLRVLPELDKVLVGMFYESTARMPLGDKLHRELRDAWKALGVEVTVLKLLAARIGYFKDMWGNRGGVVFEVNGQECRRNVYDLLTKRQLGKLKTVCLCWGFGIGYKDYFRIDVPSDAAIYDFDTSNGKLSLVANDIAGGIRELRQGHRSWENGV